MSVRSELQARASLLMRAEVVGGQKVPIIPLLCGEKSVQRINKAQVQASVRSFVVFLCLKEQKNITKETRFYDFSDSPERNRLKQLINRD